MKAAHIIEEFDKAGAFFGVRQEKLTTEGGIVLDNKVANIREDTGEVLGVVSPNYKVIPYESGVVIPAANALAESGLNLDGAEVSVQFAKNGGRMLGVITLPEEKMFVDTPGGQDEHQLQILLRSGHDADFFVDFRPGAIRMACLNGQYNIHSIGQFRGKHTSGFDAGLLQSEAKTMLTGFKEAGQRWSQWSQKDITKDQAARVLGIYCRQAKDSLNRGVKGIEEQRDKRMTKVVSLFDRYNDHEAKEIGETAWGVYNTMTWDATHSDLSEGKEATSAVLRHQNVNRVITNRYWTEQLKLAA